MTGNGTAMVLASFAADALALGVHWIYDTARIKEQYGRVAEFIAPGQESYHAGKKRGEFTHYGDQALVLLESVAASRGFILEDFAQRWRALFHDYHGYYDAATKGTLRQFGKGKSPQESGSPSDDLAGASRIAPLVYCYQHDVDALIQAARAQTRMTHKDELTVDCAEFFARVAWDVLKGSSPRPAIKEVSQQHFADSPLSAWVEEGLATTGQESMAAIKHFGQTCHTPDAFPGVIHLIAKYENDLEEGLVQAVMAGGDSAARGMAVGMILGAHLGEDSIPAAWLTDMKKAPYIRELLQRLG